MAPLFKKHGRGWDASAEQRGVDRINSFSDAVFAVAITLLILTIVVPEVSNTDQLAQELTDMWPKFMGFLLSFVIIGSFWMNHHNMFGYLKRSTPGLLRTNLLLLMFIVLLPFSTDLMSEYNSSVLATVFYEVNMAVIAILMGFLWWYVSYHEDLVDETVSPALRRHLMLVYLSMALIFCISIAIAFLSIPASLYFYLALIPTSAFLDRVLRKDTEMTEP